MHLSAEDQLPLKWKWTSVSFLLLFEAGRVVPLTVLLLHSSVVLAAGSAIAIIIALIVIAVVLYFAYKYFQRRKKSKAEAAAEVAPPSYAAHNQAPYMATGVPAMKVDPDQQTTPYPVSYTHLTLPTILLV